ncbi:MAG: hypothetical protein V6Z81_03315 [Parvularculales bacterium]
MKTLTAIAFALTMAFAFGSPAHANDNFWCNVEYNWTGGGDCAPGSQLLGELSLITPAHAGDQLPSWDCFVDGWSDPDPASCR